MRLFEERKHFARSCAPSSLIVKYQWPDECALKFEISPSTHTEAKRASSAIRTELVSSDTLSGRFSASSKSAANKGWLIKGNIFLLEAQFADAIIEESGPHLATRLRYIFFGDMEVKIREHPHQTAPCSSWTLF